MLIDLDDTIVTSEVNRKVCWETVNSEFKPVFPNVEQITRYASERMKWFWSDPERHRMWRFDLRGARSVVLKEAFLKFGKYNSILAESISDRFSELKDMRTKLFPGAIETLESLRDMNIKLALVTNGNAYRQRAKVEQFKLEELFDFIFIEGEQGYGKPMEKAYLEPLKKLGARPVESWMAGDKLDWEVEVPQRLGMKSVWVNSRGEPFPDNGLKPFVTLKTFSDIMKIFE